MTTLNDRPGDLGLAMQDYVLSLFAGKTPGSDGNLFTTYDAGTDIYVRNSTSPLASLDLTGLPLQERGALISPIHMAAANHYNPGVGGTFKFLDSAGMVVTRTVASVRHADENTDILLFKLNAAVPNTVTPLPLLGPESWPKYNPYGYRHPGVWVRWSNRTVWAGDAYWGSDNPGCGVTALSSPPPAWNQQAVGGDSGSPLMLLVPGEPTPVFMTAMHLSNVGTQWSWYLDTIRPLVQADGYDLSFVDVSSYPDV